MQDTALLFLLLNVSCLCNNVMGYVTNDSGTDRFLQESFLHRLMRKPIEWKYVVNLSLFLLRKSKDASQIIRSLWKGGNNRIRFQTKDDVTARPNGTERERFEPRGNDNLKLRNRSSPAWSFQFTRNAIYNVNFYRHNTAKILSHRSYNYFQNGLKLQGDIFLRINI